MKKFFSFIILLFTIFVGLDVVKADGNIEITDVSLIDKSNDTIFNVSSFEGLNLNINATIYNVNDFFKYKITLKNNTDENLVIEDITDNNEIEFINNSYSFSQSDFKVGESVEVVVTTKYVKEITRYKENYNNNLIIIINYTNGESTTIVNDNNQVTDNSDKLNDSDDLKLDKKDSLNNSNNPKTLDDVFNYIIIFTICLVLLIILVVKNKKIRYICLFFVLFLSIYNIKAIDVTIKVNNNLNLELYGSKYNLVEKILSKKNDSEVNYNNGNKKEVFTFNHAKTDQTEALTDYRYIGKDNNNYVYFNCSDELDPSTCEIWKIIGVFSVDDGNGVFEQRAKIVRLNAFNDYMPWNTGETNDWATASLNKFLNGDYYNRSGDASDYGLKESAREMIDDAVFYLGGTKLDYDTTTLGSVEEMYAWERGNKVYTKESYCEHSSAYICYPSYCNSDSYKTLCNYYNAAKNSIGKVGLLYPSDAFMIYGKGVNDECFDNPYGCFKDGYNNSILNDEWLRDGFFISPLTNRPDEVFYGNYSYLNYTYSYMYCAYGPGCSEVRKRVYPTVYLKPDVFTIGGTGSLDNPYQLLYGDEYVSSNYVYFEKPNEWANPYAYLTGDYENNWPGIKLSQVTGNIYSFRIKNSMIPEEKNIDELNLQIQFNNGGSTYNSDSKYKYKLSKVNFDGVNKVYKVTEGSTTTDEQSIGFWYDYENKEVLGRIYFNVPSTWNYPHAYLYRNSDNLEPFGNWPGIELTKYKDNTYYFEVTSDMIDDDITNYSVVFNNGGSYYNQSDASKKYKLSDVNIIGYEKVYNPLTNYNSTSGNSTGEWIDLEEG